ncbi:hypothetical protein B0H17DRAFT_1329286 [Mycena rosella]|uniref:Uncharacterized protein n=1 Tax=Mycena rosella TaxID=1033263 RepID=A0AAD7DPE1_MYCRO|nr:hypothetical protein B0H17DRAFT_1329286 [Mycena rosella]
MRVGPDIALELPAASASRLRTGIARVGSRRDAELTGTAQDRRDGELSNEMIQDVFHSLSLHLHPPLPLVLSGVPAQPDARSLRHPDVSPRVRRTNCYCVARSRAARSSSVVRSSESVHMSGPRIRGPACLMRMYAASRADVNRMRKRKGCAPIAGM